jgi:hypothetical protein
MSHSDTRRPIFLQEKPTSSSLGMHSKSSLLHHQVAWIPCTGISLHAYQPPGWAILHTIQPTASNQKRAISHPKKTKPTPSSPLPLLPSSASGPGPGRPTPVPREPLMQKRGSWVSPETRRKCHRRSRFRPRRPIVFFTLFESPARRLS